MCVWCVHARVCVADNNIVMSVYSLVYIGIGQGNRPNCRSGFKLSIHSVCTCACECVCVYVLACMSAYVCLLVNELYVYCVCVYVCFIE